MLKLHCAGEDLRVSSASNEITATTCSRDRRIQPRKRRKISRPEPVSTKSSNPEEPANDADVGHISPAQALEVRTQTPRNSDTPSSTMKPASDDALPIAQRTRTASFPVPFVNAPAISPRLYGNSSDQAEIPNDADSNSQSFVNRTAILPDCVPGLDASPTDSTSGPPGNNLSPVDMQVLKLRKAFDLPPLSLRQSLVEAFFERCWTWMPVVDPDTFHQGQPSFLLLQAVCLAGSQMRLSSSNFATSAEYLSRAKALLDTNYEKDPLKVLAALCMVQWWNGTAPNIVSTTTSRFWVTYAISVAQQLGLHRKPKPGLKDVGLRKRIWWTIYVRAPSKVSFTC